MATTILQGSRAAFAGAFEQVTIDATSGGKGFTKSKFYQVDPTQSTGPAGSPTVKNAKSALVTLEGTPGTNDIRFTLDTTAPTASVGHYLIAGSTLVIDGTENLLNFRAIRVGGTSGILSVTYFD